MRLRKVKNARERLMVDNNKYFINEPENYKGKWNELFSNNNPLHIEIGCGKGQFMSTLAKLNPDINYIAIEKFDSVLLRCLEKIINDDIPNLKIAVMDAAVLGTYFSDNEVDRIYLNFSDPWPKKRHAKKRLTSDVFLEKYDKIFKNKKTIIMKTDNRDLFISSIESLSSYGYGLSDVSFDLHKSEEYIITTEYEEKFMGIGNPIYYLVGTKE
jgi:tRNA (guanine-N7-)-methyltransferase